MAQNITKQYRESEEYRVWMYHMKQESGDKFNEYLAEMAIAIHLNNPQLYKELEKEEKKKKSKEAKKEPREYTDLVKLYEEEDYKRIYTESELMGVKPEPEWKIQIGNPEEEDCEIYKLKIF